MEIPTKLMHLVNKLYCFNHYHREEEMKEYLINTRLSLWLSSINLNLSKCILFTKQSFLDDLALPREMVAIIILAHTSLQIFCCLFFLFFKCFCFSIFIAVYLACFIFIVGGIHLMHSKIKSIIDANLRIIKHINRLLSNKIYHIIIHTV